MIKQILKKILMSCFCLLPLQNIILFESHPDYSDNTLALFEYFLKKGLNEKYKLVWLLNYETTEKMTGIKNVHSIYRYPKSFKARIEFYYLYCCAKYIIDCNQYVNPVRKNQVRLYLSHAVPLKIMQRYFGNLGRTDVMTTLSKYFAEITSEVYPISKENVLGLGFPRNDVLIKTQENREKKKELYGEKKVIIWMPTYRQHKHGDSDNTLGKIFPLGIPAVHTKEDFKNLTENLDALNVTLLFRPHPAQDMSSLDISLSDNFVLANDDYLSEIGVKLYELLAMTDALITDYSSVYYDYLLLDNPIALTIEDLSVYTTMFPICYDDYKKNIRGTYVYSFDDLMGFVTDVAKENDLGKKERQAVRDLYHDVKDGTSKERIYNYLHEQYGL